LTNWIKTQEPRIDPSSSCIMSTSIRLLTNKTKPKETLQVLLIPAGNEAPPMFAGMFSEGKVTASLSRMVYETGGSCFCLLGIDATCSTKSIRIAAARALKSLRTSGMNAISFDLSGLPSDIDNTTTGRSLAEGLAIASFDTKPYAGTASNKSKLIKEVTVKLEPRFHRGFREGLLLGQAVTTARRLAATPPNMAGPSQMEAYTKNLAKACGMSVRVVDAKTAAKLGMGGLLAVGQGSADPPRLVILEWKPTSAKSNPPILLVGKSVTYDSGGLSIKPDGGKGMKADKSGGCTLLGVMEAIALQKLRTRVVCILAIAENMIDANCYRLDDIITHCNGVTCEITNTDAEGRLVLADALAWGTKAYKPSTVIDAATLTGGVLVALGRTTTGVFCNNQDLMARLEHAAKQSDEKIWQLPLDDELREKMKSNIADLHNSSPSRYAQAGTGAAYLSFFVGEDAPKSMPTTPWIHLDIAGTAVSDGDADWEGLYPKGPTGWGVRTLVSLIAELAIRPLQ
jgi:leucyl aminopeptidase